MLVGDEGVERLRAARAAVFGIGGVGGYVAEALVRAGVGAIDLIDFDKVDVTNINRQIIALHSTVGMYKTDAAKQRLSDINPECSITTHNIMYLPDTADMLDLSAFDCIADAIDNVTGKLTIIERAQEAGCPSYPAWARETSSTLQDLRQPIYMTPRYAPLQGSCATNAAKEG